MAYYEEVSTNSDRTAKAQLLASDLLEQLTRSRSTFTLRSLDWLVARTTNNPAFAAALRDAVLGHSDVLALRDPQTGKFAGVYSTKQAYGEEKAVLQEAAMLTKTSIFCRLFGAAACGSASRRAKASRTLRGDQAGALDYTVSPGGLKLISGRAGTGKSYAIGAIREACERSDKRVIGLAPTNIVARDMAASGFDEARTVHLELYRRKDRKQPWDKKTVLIIDEAAMLETLILKGLLHYARKDRAKVILVGDQRQLSAVGRGGMFAELCRRYGTCEISQIVRQSVEWQREAATRLSQGDVKGAVGLFADHNAIHLAPRHDGAIDSLVEHWRQSAKQRPEASRLVFAYTNRDVARLNASLRRAWRDIGQISGQDIRLKTTRGTLPFARGDHIQLTGNDLPNGLINGMSGRVLAVAANRLTMQADDGERLEFHPKSFNSFAHGYAGTIHRGQGKTVDESYLLHTHHWRDRASYVALTRQRHAAHIFASQETARNTDALARMMARADRQECAVAYDVG